MGRSKAEVESTEVESTPVEVTEVEETPKAKRGRKKATEVVESTPAADPIIKDAPIVDAASIIEKAASEVVEESPIVEQVAEPTPELTLVAEEVKSKADEVKVEKNTVTKPTPIFGVNEVKSYKAKVTAKVAANVMAGPGIDFPRVGAMPNGSFVTITDVDGNWGCIGGHRWININFVEKV